MIYIITITVIDKKETAFMAVYLHIDKFLFHIKIYIYPQLHIFDNLFYEIKIWVNQKDNSITHKTHCLIK